MLAIWRNPTQIFAIWNMLIFAWERRDRKRVQPEACLILLRKNEIGNLCSLKRARVCLGKTGSGACAAWSVLKSAWERQDRELVQPKTCSSLLRKDGIGNLCSLKRARVCLEKTGSGACAAWSVLESVWERRDQEFVQPEACSILLRKNRIGNICSPKRAFLALRKGVFAAWIGPRLGTALYWTVLSGFMPRVLSRSLSDSIIRYCSLLRHASVSFFQTSCK
jgi:hypothetical protein